MKKIFLIGIMVAVVFASLIFMPKGLNTAKADIVHPNCFHFGYWFDVYAPDTCWSSPHPVACSAYCSQFGCFGSMNGVFIYPDDWDCYCGCYSDDNGGIT